MSKASLYHKIANNSSMASVVRRGFTIVELLIVVVVIAILAAITVVSYNGITGQSKDAVAKSDLSTAVKKLLITKVESGSFPDTKPDFMAESSTYQKTASGFCVEATANNKTFFATESTSPKEGECPEEPVDPAVAMQTVTTANCPTTRTMKVDARDNRTYWIQKMPDNKCWMLTDLAYAGGGTNTHGDTKAIQNGTGDASSTYTEPKYYVHANANPTTNPTLPSTSTDGGATSPQYGYLYNWCAAMGAQTATSACASTNTPLPDTNVSICPANWRLPTGQATTGEFTLLNNAINGGLTDTDAGLRASWLAQLGGSWSGGFYAQGGYGYYWSATQSSAGGARSLSFGSSVVSPAGNYSKVNGYPVRCVAS